MTNLQLSKITDLIESNALSFDRLNGYANSLQFLITNSAELYENRSCAECKELMGYMAQANELSRFIEKLAEAIG